MSAPSPNELWEQATSELIAAEGAGWSAGRRTARYIELMREHGHIIDRKKGDESPLLPCGWPHLSDEDERQLNDDLARMARQRRRAEVESRNLEMP